MGSKRGRGRIRTRPRKLIQETRDDDEDATPGPARRRSGQHRRARSGRWAASGSPGSRVPPGVRGSDSRWTALRSAARCRWYRSGGAPRVQHRLTRASRPARGHRGRPPRWPFSFGRFREKTRAKCCGDTLARQAGVVGSIPAARIRRRSVVVTRWPPKPESWVRSPPSALFGSLVAGEASVATRLPRSQEFVGSTPIAGSLDVFFRGRRRTVTRRCDKPEAEVRLLPTASRQKFPGPVV